MVRIILIGLSRVKVTFIFLASGLSREGVYNLPSRACQLYRSSPFPSILDKKVIIIRRRYEETRVAFTFLAELNSFNDHNYESGIDQRGWQKARGREDGRSNARFKKRWRREIISSCPGKRKI